MDPNNVEFVLFIRAVKFPQWYPLSVVKGGSAANVLARAMEYELGRLLYGKTLVRNIGQVWWPVLALRLGRLSCWTYDSLQAGSGIGALPGCCAHELLSCSLCPPAAYWLLCASLRKVGSQGWMVGDGRSMIRCCVVPCCCQNRWSTTTGARWRPWCGAACP